MEATLMLPVFGMLRPISNYLSVDPQLNSGK